MCWTAIEMPMRRRSLNVRVSGSSRSANRRSIGTQPEVVGDEPLDKRRDPAQKPPQRAVSSPWAAIRSAGWWRRIAFSKW